jgi:hypothetical protein
MKNAQDVEVRLTNQSRSDSSRAHSALADSGVPDAVGISHAEDESLLSKIWQRRKFDCGGV